MEHRSDAEFANRALAHLRGAEASGAFQAALLAGYDGWRAHRRGGPVIGLKAALRGFSEIVWPGAPLWLPTAALAASLILGLTLGALVPVIQAQRMGFSLERTPGFSLLADQEAEL